jgi:hypothetical protein
VSVRHDRDPNRYLMSRSLAPALVTVADIMEWELESTPVDPPGRRLPGVAEGLPNRVRVASYHLPLIHTYPQAETYKMAVTYQLLCKRFIDK